MYITVTVYSPSFAACRKLLTQQMSMQHLEFLISAKACQERTKLHAPPLHPFSTQAATQRHSSHYPYIAIMPQSFSLMQSTHPDRSLLGRLLHK